MRNKENYKQYQQKWRQEHPDYFKKYFTNYHRPNKQVKVYDREYYLKHKDEKRESVKRWRKNNPDKFRLLLRIRRHQIRANGKINAKEWLEKCALLGNRCQICERSADETKLTIDHIIPISKGGDNDIGNLQPLCFSCNSRKRDKLPEVMIPL